MFTKNKNDKILTSEPAPAASRFIGTSGISTSFSAPLSLAGLLNENGACMA